MKTIKPLTSFILRSVVCRRFGNCLPRLNMAPQLGNVKLGNVKLGNVKLGNVKLGNVIRVNPINSWKNLMPKLTHALITVASIAVLLSNNAFAQSNATYTALPPSNSESATPLVMLTLSRDHQYFFKAYNDYSDLDPEANDGIETTYKHSFQYFGYFNPLRCYRYNASSGEFAVRNFSARDGRYCNVREPNQWSGNFLNWATMTRMDVLRKIFYGGKRSTDTNGKTVLERAFLPTDAHSFAKYYNGDDISRLTPYDLPSDGNGGNNNGVDDLNEGITICNTSYSDVRSQDSTAPPLMRVARGNYQLWAANERWQCTWRDEKDVRVNGNIADGLTRPNNPTVAVDTETTINGETVDLRSGLNAYNVNPIDAHSLPNTGNTAPATASNRDFVVRLNICNRRDVFSFGNLSGCQEYPSNVRSKPVGLLHTYGEQDLISFGLMTGSYSNNTQGGVLRKNIESFRGEFNEDNGTFEGGEVNQETGIFNRDVNGIVNTLDRLRIFGYTPSAPEGESSGVYFGSSSGDNCGFLLTDIVNGSCNSWGNPISEIYKESLRYISGLSPTAAFNASDDAFISGLVNEAWEDPLSNDNQCAPLSNIVVNASVSSYDDDLNGIADLAGSPNVDVFTNRVGNHEGISGNDFFVGQAGGNNNQICDAKTVGSLASVTGVCPEGPTIDGTYAMAGMSYYARNTDLRRGTGFEGDQTLETYGITLVTNSPVIQVPVGRRGVASRFVTILPAYRLLSGDGGGGALVDFRVVQDHVETAPGIFSGRFLLVWEDSEQGGDFDADILGTISYEMNAPDNKITITTFTISKSTPGPQLFGFITSGTTQDGFHAYSGINDANFSGVAGVPGCTNCRAALTNDTTDKQVGPQSHTFTVNTGADARSLESPLYYAAKYGSFRDEGQNGPDSDEEWDRINNVTGDSAGDGIPDNYFEVTNPGQLQESLGNALAEVLANRSTSGTAPANLANADGTGGVIVQALFFDTLENRATNETVNWSGELHAFFVDEFGLFREDNATRGTRFQLDGPNIDQIFTYVTDPDSLELMIQRFTLPNPNLPVEEGVNEPQEDGAPVPVNELQTIWSANDQLASLDNSAIVNQRGFNQVVSNSGPSRFIKTWFDRNKNGRVDSGEEIDFTAAQASLTDTGGVPFARYFGFGVDDTAPAETVINFIRGQDGLPETRSRAITESVAGRDVNTVKRLGDIVNSTPLIVAPPNERFDVTFGDDSYQRFRAQYANRRQVMYVGGNDGLLHAFNTGFKQFSPDSAISFSERNPRNPSDTQHPIGAELWAYAPFNLLPHLRWLVDPRYSHVFYVDGEPKAYDVNIFPNDADHPNGWGTILVVGMRLGGGEFPLNLNSNDSDDLQDATDLAEGRSCQDLCTRSSYIVLDITNPERPPTVIAEINDNLLNNGRVAAENQLHHTLGTPTLVKRRVPGPGNNFINPAVNEWSLVFGSGPSSRTDVRTGDSAKFYRFDLVTKELTRETIVLGGNELTRTFVGNFVATDWDSDYQDDVAYFGTVGVIPGRRIDGRLMRYVVDTGSLNTFFNPQRPVSTTPLVSRIRGREFVHFGTGRYLSERDTSGGEEFYYGVIEPVNSNYTQEVPRGNVVDTTDVEVEEDGQVSMLPSALAGRGIETFQDLQDTFIADNNFNGWLRRLEQNGVAGNRLPAERVSADSASVRSQILFTGFTPDGDVCAANSGSSRLFVLDLATGTPSDFGGLGFEGDFARDSVDLGPGRASFPIVLTATGLGSNRGRVIIQKDDGSIVGQDVLLGKPQDSERLNWRELIGQ